MESQMEINTTTREYTKRKKKKTATKRRCKDRSFIKSAIENVYTILLSETKT